MGTLISDLQDAPGQGGDEDFVNSILREMNVGGGDSGVGGGAQPSAASFIQPPPAIGSQVQASVISAPNPNTVAPRVMDNGPATAHMIGNSHPTAADFIPIMGSGGGAGAGAGPIPTQGSWGSSAAAYGPPAAVQNYVPRAPKKGFIGKIIDEFRTSFLVTILVFVFSLPVVNFLFAHYLPSMVKATGELTPIGLGIKALAAGGAFWILQRVIVPLLTL